MNIIKNSSTICLNMIVKNEAHVILETLINLTSYIDFDYWVISDTGSTDNTKEIIQTFSYGISTVFILFALAFGVAFPVVVFKSYTVKGKDLNVMIKKLFARNSEET